MTNRETSILLALADAVAAPEPPLPPVAETDAATAFARWLSSGPRHNRMVLRAGLRLLDRSGGRQRFSTGSRAHRLGVLQRLQRSAVPGVSQVADALRAGALMSYHGDPRVMRSLGYDAEERVRALRVRRAQAGYTLPTRLPAVRTSAPSAIRADVCVVGAGAGGSVVAKELAEAGVRVVVLEQGHGEPASTLTGSPREMLLRLYRDGGQSMTIGSPPILLPLGRGIGGTTFVNSGTCFRTPPRVLERWQRECGLEGLDEGTLAPIFHRVEQTLGVDAVPASIAGKNAEIARRGAERLGWSGGFLDRNARGCQGSGVCAFGCPTGAKQHAGDAYLRPACDAGAEVYTGMTARRIVMRGSRATGVEARAVSGHQVTVASDAVVLAAGTIVTPLLLAASGVRSRALGRNLSLHPATAVWGRFAETVDMAYGVPQSYYVDEFASEGIMLEGIAGPPDYLAMSVPLHGDEHRDLMLDYRQVAQFGLMVSDRSRGRVRGTLRAPIVRYDLCADDLAAVHHGAVRLAELFQAAGASVIHLPFASLGTVEAADLDALRALRLRRRDLKLMAFHPLGTARAHVDSRHGVVDGDLRVHGTENLFVADGSAVPTALGVNPQITIMALATRLALHLRGAPCPS